MPSREGRRPAATTSGGSGPRQPCVLADLGARVAGWATLDFQRIAGLEVVEISFGG